MSNADAATDPWTAVIGQPEVTQSLRAAVSSPVHAYMFLGPAGTGKKLAAGVFAGELLAESDPDNADRHRSLATRFVHPDVRLVTPTGSEFRLEESQRLVAEASRSPMEGTRKVVIAERFHDANSKAMPVLLKVAEEPPDSTIFIFLADRLAPEQVTVASRCTRIEFGSIHVDQIVAALVADGVDAEVAARSAEASGGNLARARVLSTDQRLMTRRDAWWSAPDRVDDTGASVAVVVEEIRGLIDDSMASLKAIHSAELEVLDEHEKQYGTRGSGRRDLEAHHRRVQRSHRNDELVFGFATLARRYREEIESADPPRARRLAEAVDRLGSATKSLDRSPNESLMLLALLLDLPPA